MADDCAADAPLHGAPAVRCARALRQPLVVAGSLGTHIVWAVQNGHAALFLERLGLPRSMTALVLMFAPLSGLLVQPTVGLLSDRCMSAWGRRRPFVVGGAAACIACLAAMAAASAMAGSATLLARALGIAGIIGIDVSLNAMAAAHRALITDLFPADEQDSVNAWGARLGGLGSVLGYVLGRADLRAATHGDQLSVLALTAAAGIAATHAPLLLYVREARLSAAPAAAADAPTSLAALVRTLVRTLWTLPRAITDLFAIQFFAWLAWFPVLFYSTAWVADIYRATSSDAEAAARAGSAAMLAFALTSLVTAVVLPPLLRRMRRGGTQPTLAQAWGVGHVVFGVALLFGTCPVYAAHSVRGATALLGVLGISWALTNWAPFSILGVLLQTDARSSAVALEAGEHAGAGGAGGSGSGLRAQAGAVYGLHNWSVVVPQLVVSLVSSAVFALPSLVFGSRAAAQFDSTGLVFRLGSLCTLVAALRTWRWVYVFNSALHGCA